MGTKGKGSGGCGGEEIEKGEREAMCNVARVGGVRMAARQGA
jgi:hypothetical protein